MPDRDPIVGPREVQPKKRPAFFLVFSPSGPTAPTKIHDSHKSAFKECHRLAEAFPGQQFFVMQSASKPIARAELLKPEMANG